MRKTFVSLFMVFLFIIMAFSAYADGFDHKAVFGDFEGYVYDKFDKEWSVYSEHVEEKSNGSFALCFKSFGEKGGENLSETFFAVAFLNNKEYADIRSIDVLIGDDLYSYNNLINESDVSRVYIGENGNLLIEALATCDPSNVAVRIKDAAGKAYSVDLNAKQFEETLKHFCAVYVLNRVWDYEVYSDAVAQLESKYPLYINGELANYETMHKDIDYDELNHFLAEIAKKHNESDNKDETTVNPAPTENSIYVVGSVGNSYIELTSWELQNDYNGKPIIVLTYTWTNNSNDTAMASLAVSVEAYQNGVSLDNAYFVGDVDSSSRTKNVRPGYSIEVQQAFKLSDAESDVEFEIKDMWDIFGSSAPIRTTIHLS